MTGNGRPLATRRWMLGAYLLALLVLSLWPGAGIRPFFELPGVTEASAHFTGYLLLAWLTCRAFPGCSGVWIWLAALGCGVLVELGQIAVPGRGFKWADIVANGAGALAGVCIARVVSRRTTGDPG